MADDIKRYNPDTRTWDISSSGKATGIVVDDPRLIDPDLAEEGKTTESLNDVLVRHDEALKKHSGYIAWLAEHGGGGGTGGGGGATGDKVTLTNGNIVKEGNTNYLYSTVTTDVKLEYLITSSKNNKRYFITVTLDGNNIIEGKEAWTNTSGILNIPQLDKFSSNSNHSVVITANNTDGFSAESYLLNIVEASIKLASSVSGSTATVGIDYFFTYSITSKIIGSDVNLVVTNVTNGASKTIELGKTTSTAPRQVNVNLWDLGSIIAGSSYTIQAQAFTSMNEQAVQSDKVTNRVVVEDGVNLVILVEGITSKAEVDSGAERTKFSQSGNISFAFIPYLAGISLIYYAVRIEHNGIVKDIGYFDEGNYNDNQYVQRGKQQVFSYAIPTEGEVLGNWNITLRCWSEKGDPVTDTVLACEVVSSSQALIADQNPNNSRYASWHIRQESFPQVSTAKVWTSNEPSFTVPGAIEPSGATTELNVYNTNGVLSGFLTKNGQSMLRISGEAYGVIDVQPFKDDVSTLNNWSRQGFGISCTFKSDRHPFSNKTIFFIGDYNTNEQFSEGIKISLEDITWSYTDGNIKETMSCKIHNGLFSPLVNLKFMDSAFSFAGTKYTDPTFLAKFKGNVSSKLIRLDAIGGTNGAIKFVSNINNSPSDETIADNLVAADSGSLFAQLPDLEYITNMFNVSNINFNQVTDEDVEDGVMYCPLFYKNTKLKCIKGSFKSLFGSKGSLYNVFGGTVKNKTNTRFPIALYGIHDSFSIADGSTITFPIHNSMFSRLKNSLKYITSYQAVNKSTLGCFQGFTKEFIKEEDEVFPYDVFTDCSAIVEIPGFFSKLILPADSVIELPLNSFKTNYNLTNISYLYYSIKNCKYSLTGKGFSNCKLVNVQSSFSEAEYSFVKKGFIPYGLFYMEQTSNVSYKGWNELDAASQNITENYGIDSDGNWIESAEMPVEITYSKRRTLPRKTIVNMSFCLERFQSTEAQGYSMNYGDLTPSNYGDIIVPNEKYNPVKYILNPNYDPREWLDDEHTMPNHNRDIHRVILNKDFDKYELAWNEYCVDGLSGLEDIVRNSALYSAISTGSINCSPVIPDRFKDDAGSFAPPSDADANRKVLNYICSPDLFYYCTNGNNMKVNGALFASGIASGKARYDYINYGLRGRIPPHLFYPISNVTDLSYTFYRVSLLNPYKWNVTNGEDGEFYSPDTFSKLTKLISLSKMFSLCIIPAHINLPVDSYVNCIQLQDISSMFLSAQFKSTSAMRQQVDGNLFNKNVNLRDISYAFASGENSGDWLDRSPKKINSTLFNADKHKRLTNVTGLFHNAVSTVGSVPEFWNWLNTLSASNRADVFYKMKKSNISNSASIPADWANGMED